MALPGRLIGKLPLLVRGQLPDHRSGQGVLTHVVQRRVVDHVVGVAGAQQVEEVQPALAAGRAEPGEVVVADLRADGVGAAMARAGVVHRDPVRRLPGQRAAPRGSSVRKSSCPSISRRMTCRLEMLTPNACSSADQPLHRHLPLVILHQHEAAQLRPEMAADAAGQRRHDGLAGRRQPALATVAHHPRGQHQILHLVRLVALELRARRTRHPQHLGLRRDPRRHLAAAAALAPLAASFGSVASSMPLGLIDGRPLSPFSRAISSRCAATIRFSSATSPSNSTTRASSSARDRPDRSAGGDMPQPNRTRPRRGKPKNRRDPGVLPR